MKKIFFILAIVLSQTSFAQLNNTFRIGENRSWAETPDSPELHLVNNFTIEAWVKVCDATQAGIIVSKQQCNNNYAFYLSIINDRLRWNFMQPNGNSCNNTINVETPIGTITDDTWHHVAFVSNTNTNPRFSMYIDGVSQPWTSTSAINNPNINIGVNPEPFRVGGYRGITDNMGSINDALLDEIRVWRTPRTASEINATMNSQLIGNEPNLVLYYNFENVIGTDEGAIIPDECTNGISNNATCFYTPTNYASRAPIDSPLGSHRIVNESTSACCDGEYAIATQTIQCNTNNNICIPITALTTVSDGIIGMNFCMNFDPTLITPTNNFTLGGVVLNNTLTPGDADAHLNIIQNGPNSSSIYGAIFYTSTAPSGSDFEGTGDIICIEFSPVASLPLSAAVLSCELEESYSLNDIPKCALSGTINITVDNDLDGQITYRDDAAKPLRYDFLAPNNYNETVISEVDVSCSSQNNETNTDLNGDFTLTFNDNSNLVSINRDIEGDFSNSTSNAVLMDLMNAINGNDTYLAAMISTFDTDDNGTAFTPNAFQMIAADVNMNTTVRANDITLIQDRIIGNINEYPQSWNYDINSFPVTPLPSNENSLDWRFIDMTTYSTDPMYQIDPLYPIVPSGSSTGFHRDNVPNIPMCLNIPTSNNGNCTSIDNENYYGILLGDVDGNWSLGEESNLKSSSLLTVDLNAADYLGDFRYKLPVFLNLNDVVNSTDFYLDYDQSELSFIDLEVTQNGLVAAHNNSQNDVLFFTCYSLNSINTESPICYITFETNGTEINSNNFIQSKGFVNGKSGGIKFNQAISSSDNLDFETGSIQLIPNPTNLGDQFVIKYNLPEGNFDLTIMSLLGKVIYTKSGLGKEGELSIPTDNMSEGLFIVRTVGSNGQSIESKIVVR